MNRYRNKYGVAPVEARTWRGKTYASKAEMEYAKDIWPLLDTGMVIEVIEQPSLWLGVPENKYRPDFFVLESSGAAYYVDVKGVETPEFRRVRKLWAAYGRLPLLIVSRKGKSWKTETIEPKQTSGLPSGPQTPTGWDSIPQPYASGH